MNDIEKIKKSKIVQDIKNGCNIVKNDITIEITTTTECNCNCKYCFESDHSKHEISFQNQERILTLLDDLCRNFDPTRYRNVNIVFWGGEPTCNFNFVKQILYKTVDFEFVSYFMYSNGLIFEKFFELPFLDIYRKIVSRFSFQLSYDGEPHHSIMRGSNSEMIFRTARMLSENGFRVSFKATLSYDMISHLPEIWKSYELLEQQFEGINYSPTLDTTVKETGDEIFQQWKKSIAQIAKLEYSFFKRKSRFLSSIFIETSESKRSCNLKSHLLIHTDGNIYICHGCPYSNNKNDFKMGNINQISSLNEILDSSYDFGSSSRHPEECDQCSAMFCNICHVSQVDSKNYEKDWFMCRTANKLRCKYFKYLGKVNIALQLALLEKNIN